MSIDQRKTACILNGPVGDTSSLQVSRGCCSVSAKTAEIHELLLRRSSHALHRVAGHHGGFGQSAIEVKPAPPWSALVVAPLTMDLPYKPWESFDFLGCTSELRIGMPVGPSMPNVRTLADFIAEGRRRPITVATRASVQR